MHFFICFITECIGLLFVHNIALAIDWASFLGLDIEVINKIGEARLMQLSFSFGQT